jgi:hypothetical protein
VILLCSREYSRSRTPWRCHSFRRTTSSWRARPRGMVKQTNLEVGLMCRKRANQERSGPEEELAVVGPASEGDGDAEEKSESRDEFTKVVLTVEELLVWLQRAGMEWDEL